MSCSSFPQGLLKSSCVRRELDNHGPRWKWHATNIWRLQAGTGNWRRACGYWSSHCLCPWWRCFSWIQQGLFFLLIWLICLELSPQVPYFTMNDFRLNINGLILMKKTTNTSHWMRDQGVWQQLLYLIEKELWVTVLCSTFLLMIGLHLLTPWLVVHPITVSSPWLFPLLRIPFCYILTMRLNLCFFDSFSVPAITGGDCWCKWQLTKIHWVALWEWDLRRCQGK